MTNRRQRQFTYLLIIFSITPFVIFASPPSASIDSWSIYLGRITGYVATILLLWQFLLGTRSVTGRFVNNQGWLIKLHKILGQWGIIVFLAHPLLIAYSYSQTLSYIIVPATATHLDKYVTLGRLAFFVYLFVWITSAIVRENIRYQPWKLLHLTSYLILPLALLHIPETGSFYAGDSAFRLSWYLMVAIFIIMALLRLRHALVLTQAKYQIVAKQKTDDSTTIYRLMPTGKRFIKPKPGQYIYLKLGLRGFEHPFSVASYNSQSHEMTLAIRTYGQFTTDLSNKSLGELVYLDGSYGNFTKNIHKSSRHAVFIAGGIGVVPFVQHITDQKLRKPWLFFCNRCPDSTIFRKVFSKKLGNQYIEIFSDHNIDEGESGFMSVDILNKYLGERLIDFDFYICGPQIMIDLVRKDLSMAGVPDKQIHIEEFGF